MEAAAPLIRRRQSPLEGRFAVWAVEAAYVLLLGFLFGKLVWTFVALFVPVITPSVDIAPPKAAAAEDLSVFSRHNPFVGAPKVATAEEAYDEVEETQLNLTLVGTFVSGDNRSATIQTEGGRQQLYFVGDEVVDGTSIEDVVADQVILSRRGVRETLSLEGRERRAVESRIPTAPVVSSAGLSQFVEVTPSGGGAGLTVRAGSRPELFRKAGLADGDRLIAVNGRPLPDNLQQAKITLLRQLTRGPMTVTVNRNGSTQDIVINPAEFSL